MFNGRGIERKHTLAFCYLARITQNVKNGPWTNMWYFQPYSLRPFHLRQCDTLTCKSFRQCCGRSKEDVPKERNAFQEENGYGH